MLTCLRRISMFAYTRIYEIADLLLGFAVGEGLGGLKWPVNGR